MGDDSGIVCLQDIEEFAHRILGRNALDFYRGGADQQRTLRDNKEAFSRQANVLN
jgi:(S)-2-hydroxy-acid oxidase